MESKLVPGLYFAGEVLDLDAVTGGFNLRSHGPLPGRPGGKGPRQERDNGAPLKMKGGNYEELQHRDRRPGGSRKTPGPLK